MRTFSVLLFLLCGQQVSFANRTGDTLHISLQEAWRKAEENSRHIEIRRKTVEIAVEEIKDARMERYPEIGVKGTAEKASNIPIYDNGLFSKPSQHEVIHTLYRAGADLYLNIYDGNKLNLKIEEDKTLHRISLIEKDQAVSDIRYKTAALYLELQKCFIFKSLITGDIADQEKQLEEIKSYHKNGTVLKSDVLRVELDLSRRKMALVTIENDILIASQQLNIIMGEPDETVVAPAEMDAHGGENVPYEQYLAEAMHHSFPYHISEWRTELSKLRVRQVKANVRPKFGVYGDFYYANPQIFLFPYNPYWYSLGVAGLKASFPVSALYHNVHKVRAARLELEKEEEIHKDTEDRVRQQVKEAYLRYKEALVQIGVAEVNVTQAAENARIIKNTYFNQASLITDLLDADIQLLRSRFELAAARITAQNKYYLLQNITGVL
ncbi:TolC family protein [Chitinophaga sp. GCM10012297]|uniref:TolC family protein n=1 Tax=Chitinophaga chungangae TaxID=2821488 RepID=A0ABS3YIK0_9BACT|nr:TolC family protein [Chitinophaga chungangae]MBO9154133.1 TolC family protein [Chitinophaga chungangae]